MLTIYITRHGQTEWNIEGRMQGWKDSKLTQKGIDDAIALGNRLSDVNFNAIYTSSSQRTINTAELIKGDKNIKIIPHDDLREINLGDWEGRKIDEIDQFDKQNHIAFFETPHLFTPKSGENFFQARDRSVAILNKIIHDNISGKILIVTHAAIVKLILSYFKNTPIEKLWDQPYIHGTCLSIIELQNNQPQIILEADISHITG